MRFRSARKLLPGLLLFSGTAVLVTGPAHASEEVRSRLVLGASARKSLTGAGLDFDARIRLPVGIQLGARVSGGFHELGYLSGFSVRDIGSFGGSGIALVPLVVSGPLELDLRVESGILALRKLDSDAPDALRQTNEIGVVAHLRLADAWMWRAGALLGFELEIDPTTELADQSQLLTTGIGFELTRHLLLHADARGGGSYGFDGDNGKVLFDGTLGLRGLFGEGGARVAY